MSYVNDSPNHDFKGDEVGGQDSQGHEAGQGHHGDGGRRPSHAAPRRKKKGFFGCKKERNND